MFYADGSGPGESGCGWTGQEDGSLEQVGDGKMGFGAQSEERGLARGLDRSFIVRGRKEGRRSLRAQPEWMGRCSCQGFGRFSSLFCFPRERGSEVIH